MTPNPTSTPKPFAYGIDTLLYAMIAGMTAAGPLLPAMDPWQKYAYAFVSAALVAIKAKRSQGVSDPPAKDPNTPPG
jgi:hypothetical protein